MGDVLEYLVDGTSGLAPGGVDGKAMVAGVCSKGQVGKAYLVGSRSDLSGLLGVGPLVDKLRDVLASCPAVAAGRLYFRSGLERRERRIPSRIRLRRAAEKRRYRG